MLTYDLYQRIRHARRERKLTYAQIARELGLDPETVAKWTKLDHYPKPDRGRKQSKLDPFKPRIRRWLEEHPYSGVQILQRLQGECGYEGGYSILKEYLALVRPRQAPAFLTLAFAPGEYAQVDWGSYGSMQIGSTRRRLSFFVMVLCYSGELLPHGVHQLLLRLHQLLKLGFAWLRLQGSARVAKPSRLYIEI